MPIPQVRKQAREEQKATQHVREAGAKFPSQALPLYPRAPVCPQRKISPLPGAGRSPGTASGSLAPRGSPQPRCPADTAGDGGRVMGAWDSSPFPRQPLSNHRLSAGHSPHNPADSPSSTHTSYEHSPGVLEPGRVAQPGGPAPGVPFARCPPVSETLDKWRGRGKKPHYEKGTYVYWTATMCQGLCWVFS